MAVSDGHVAAGAVVEGGARRVHGIGRVRYFAVKRVGFRAFDTPQTFRCASAISRICSEIRQISLTTPPWTFCLKRAPCTLGPWPGYYADTAVYDVH